MLRRVRMGVIGISLYGLFCVSDCSIRAGTIITLSLGGEASIGIQFNGTELSTVGQQNTAAEFVDFLALYPDIVTPTASFTLTDLMASNPPGLYGGSLIVQQFTGGTFSLYDPANTLLLSGDLSTPALTGTVGLPGGGLFTTSLSTVTGGTLAPYFDPGTLVLQMHLSNINYGEGFSVGPAAPSAYVKLNPFTADATVDIGAEPIPGDYNHDNTVDAADYVVWRHRVGWVVPPGTNGDANGNGFVEWIEYEPWRENYGRTAGGGPGITVSAAIPEPSTLAIILAASLIMMLQRGARCRHGSPAMPGAND